MFEIAITELCELVKILPIFIVVIYIMNLICSFLSIKLNCLSSTWLINWLYSLIKKTNLTNKQIFKIIKKINITIYQKEVNI